MKIIVDVPVERVEFALELFRCLTFVKSARLKKAAKQGGKNAPTDQDAPPPSELPRRGGSSAETQAA